MTATGLHLLGDLRAKHRDGVRKSRRMVIGKRGKPIRCDERNKCRECPFGRKPEDREHQEVSWNQVSEAFKIIHDRDKTSNIVIPEVKENEE